MSCNRPDRAIRIVIRFAVAGGICFFFVGSRDYWPSLLAQGSTPHAPSLIEVTPHVLTTPTTGIRSEDQSPETVPDKSWLTNAISVSVGAFLGAFLGYLFNRYLRRQEIEARRRILLKALAEELQRIDPIMPGYVSGMTMLGPTLRLSALPLLLDGEALDLDHASLMQALLRLQVAVASYNDVVTATNLALVMGETMGSVAEQARQEIYQTLSNLYRAVSEEREAVLSVLSE